MKQLRFRAIAGVNVLSPPHIRGGTYRPIGKTYDPETRTWKVDETAHVFTLAGDHAHEDLHFLRRCVLDGELAIVDQATADHLEIKFEAPPAAPSAEEHAAEAPAEAPAHVPDHSAPSAEEHAK